MLCRVCHAKLGLPDYSAPAPALTDAGHLLDMATEVYVCPACGLAQSPDMPDVRNFYAHQYKFSLGSYEHDQIVSLSDGRSVFRTDLQVESVLTMAPPPRGARVLDYGCGKAGTLRKLANARPDIVPHTFDVSDDYRQSWADWVAPENCASHVTPPEWRGRFDIVTCHFVLEHVVDVPAVLANLRDLLAPGGRLFLSVPNALANPGDLLVADHLSHFARGSLANALAMSALKPLCIDSAAFPGALLSVSEATEERIAVRPDPESADVRRAAADWSKIGAAVRQAAQDNSGRPTAIYGAGFYGSFIRTALGDREELKCFLDANPHLQGTTHMGLPVVAPSSIPPEVTIVYAGLNPLKARAILSNHPDLEGRTIVWLQ
jgi:SAM-dependent methyltransferase